MAAIMNPQPPIPPPNNGPVDKQGVMASVPAWGSFLYQNFLLPAFSPSEWLNNTPGQANTTMDYFGSQPTSTQSQSPRMFNTMPFSQPGPSFYNGQYFAPPSAIPTSLLTSQQPSSSSSNISPSVDIIDNLVASPSPIMPVSTLSPKRGSKRRAGSLDSNESFDDHPDADHDHEIAEGVERDGMIWGMKVEDYRALSARERKRVRNRISARTFRAKRKEHLSSLELDLEAKDSQIKAANDEARILRKQVAELRARLSKYERV